MPPILTRISGALGARHEAVAPPLARELAALLRRVKARVDPALEAREKLDCS